MPMRALDVHSGISTERLTAMLSPMMAQEAAACAFLGSNRAQKLTKANISRKMTITARDIRISGCTSTPQNALAYPLVGCTNVSRAALTAWVPHESATVTVPSPLTATTGATW